MLALSNFCLNRRQLFQQPTRSLNKISLAISNLKKVFFTGSWHVSLESPFILCSSALWDPGKQISFSKLGRHMASQMRESNLGQGSGNQILHQWLIKTTVFSTTTTTQPFFHFFKFKSKHTVKKSLNRTHKI